MLRVENVHVQRQFNNGSKTKINRRYTFRILLLSRRAVHENLPAI